MGNLNTGCCTAQDQYERPLPPRPIQTFRKENNSEVGSPPGSPKRSLGNSRLPGSPTFEERPREVEGDDTNLHVVKGGVIAFDQIDSEDDPEADKKRIKLLLEKVQQYETTIKGLNEEISSIRQQVERIENAQQKDEHSIRENETSESEQNVKIKRQPSDKYTVKETPSQRRKKFVVYKPGPRDIGRNSKYDAADYGLDLKRDAKTDFLKERLSLSSQTSAFELIQSNEGKTNSRKNPKKKKRTPASTAAAVNEQDKELKENKLVDVDDGKRKMSWGGEAVESDDE